MNDGSPNSDPLDKGKIPADVSLLAGLNIGIGLLLLAWGVIVALLFLIFSVIIALMRGTAGSTSLLSTLLYGTGLLLTVAQMLVFVIASWRVTNGRVKQAGTAYVILSVTLSSSLILMFSQTSAPYFWRVTLVGGYLLASGLYLILRAPPDRSQGQRTSAEVQS